ncbi:MAG: DNA repair protein RecN [Planctomycetes bacterium]|nr:DNA repair protein RecN [Planctomycetota bacterium]
MLAELVIENLALLQRAALKFGAGLNVITGETGAGKSLLIGALELLLGERPRVSLVRQGAEEARVEGRFVLQPEAVRAPSVREFFGEHLPAVLEDWRAQPADEERELILCRALTAAGKTRAWVNHRPVTQRLLRDLAGLLVEVHGQNEHQRLLDAAEQTRLLDAFGESEAALARYATARAAWVALANDIAEFERRARDTRERADLLRFQARELNAAKVQSGERQALEQDRDRLRYANDLTREVGGVAAALAGEEASALDLARHAQRTLEHWERKVPELAAHAEEVRQAVAHLEEAAAGVEQFLARVEAAPERLEEVERRLYEIELLEKKYRTDCDGLAEKARAIEAELSAIDTHDEQLERRVRERDAGQRAVAVAAAELSKQRRACSARLEKAVHKSLADLGLERARFQVQIEPRTDEGPNSPNADPEKARQLALERRFAHDGADRVEFFLAANPGEGLEPLRKVASGGETARIMLALRTALAVKQTIPTLVFDEVDSGVGGRLGPKIGEHLRALSARHQVLCVTHLPAVAAAAHDHFRVRKTVEGGRTQTAVEVLNGTARIAEVADMIAGGAAHETALAEARRLLGESAAGPATATSASAPAATPPDSAPAKRGKRSRA